MSRDGDKGTELDTKRTCNPHLPFCSNLPAINDLGGSGNRAEIAQATASTSPSKGRGRERSEPSTAETAHSCHVTHVVHGAHGAKRTKA